MSKHPVKWFHSLMRGIPLVSGQVGSLLALLEATLVNGFGQTDSNKATVSNKVVTIEIKNNETFEVYSIVEISGNDLLNGEHRVIGSTNDYIEIELDIPDQTINSTFYIKYAPLGWSKITPNTPANTALFIPKSSYSGFNLYVNDNYNNGAEVKICRGTTDSTDFTNKNVLIDHQPNAMSGSNMSTWYKSHTNSSATRASFLVGDGSGFYYQWGRTDQANNADWLRRGKVVGVGDINRYDDTDDLSAFIFCPLRASNQMTSGNVNVIAYKSFQEISTTVTTPRTTDDSTFLGNAMGEKIATVARNVPDGGFTDNWSGYRSLPLDYVISGKGLELVRILALDDKTIRGEYPGIYWIPYEITGSTKDLDIVHGSGNMEGRLILFKMCSVGNGNYDSETVSGATSTLAFDITGPWR